MISKEVQMTGQNNRKERLSRSTVAGGVLVTAAAVLWGCISLFTRELNEVGLDSMKIVCVRMIGSSLIMAAVFLVTDRSMFRIRFQDLWMFFGTGIVSQVLYNWCYFHCMRISSVSVSAALRYTSPAFSLLLSLLIFKERLTVRKSISLVLTVAGCMLIAGVIGKGEDLSSMVIISGLGAGLGYALYSVFGRFALSRYSPLKITFWTNVCGGAFSLVLVNQIGLARQLMHFDVTETVLLLIIVGTIIPLFLYTKGLTFLENGRAGILAAAEPVAAALIGWFVFDDALTVFQAAGIILVIIAAAVVATEREVRGIPKEQVPKQVRQEK